MSVSVFAERLRNAMNSRGLKQVDLVHAAEHRGVKMGKSHISQYVAGKTMPREDVLEFLASARSSFHCSGSGKMVILSATPSGTSWKFVYWKA